MTIGKLFGPNLLGDEHKPKKPPPAQKLPDVAEEPAAVAFSFDQNAPMADTTKETTKEADAAQTGPSGPTTETAWQYIEAARCASEIARQYHADTAAEAAGRPATPISRNTTGFHD